MTKIEDMLLDIIQKNHTETRDELSDLHKYMDKISDDQHDISLNLALTLQDIKNSQSKRESCEIERKINTDFRKDFETKSGMFSNIGLKLFSAASYIIGPIIAIIFREPIVRVLTSIGIMSGGGNVG